MHTCGGQGSCPYTSIILRVPMDHHVIAHTYQRAAPNQLAITGAARCAPTIPFYIRQYYVLLLRPYTSIILGSQCLESPERIKFAATFSVTPASSK